ncbi:hypothetical protein [Aquitalea pelogenes]|uniref:hypothetical protein n=1 Tax=Aquitalea pelogenes TaxID=1293573 RepID=UPI0035AFE569
MKRTELNVITGEIAEVKLSAEEIAAIEEAAAGATWINLQSQANTALLASDTTILRCYENAVAVPEEWANYRRALREIISTSIGDPAQTLPIRPAYPAGT